MSRIGIVGGKIVLETGERSGIVGGKILQETSADAPTGFKAYFAIEDEVLFDMKKNVASQTISAQMVTISDGSDFTGTVTVTVTKDGGTQTAGGGTVTHEGGGEHSYAPTQAETNADFITFSFSGTGAITRGREVYTTFPQTGDNFARLGAPAGASVSADIAVIEGQTDDIGVAGAGLTAINLPNQTMDITGNLSGSVGSVTAINTTGGAIDDVTLVATTTTNTDMRGTDGANTVVPDAAGVAPTAVENRQEMDSNSVDLDAIQSNQTTINSNVLAIPTTAMRGTDSAATSAKQDTMETTLNAIPTTAMRGTDGANTVVPDAANGASVAADETAAKLEQPLPGDPIRQVKPEPKNAFISFDVEPEDTAVLVGDDTMWCSTAT